MRRTLGTSCLALAIAAAPGAAAHAAEPVTHGDTWNDVRILRAEGLSRADRRSIDLRRVKVVEVGDMVRFSVTIKDVVRGKRFDQMFFFSLTPGAGSDAEWQGQLGFTSRGPLAYAYWMPSADYDDLESCDPLRSKSNESTNRVWLDVPRRCVPGKPAVIRVEALTGTFRSDAPVFSRDRARVPGLHVVKD